MLLQVVCNQNFAVEF